jgi:hypothetical protein
MFAKGGRWRSPQPWQKLTWGIPTLGMQNPARSVVTSFPFVTSSCAPSAGARQSLVCSTQAHRSDGEPLPEARVTFTRAWISHLQSADAVRLCVAPACFQEQNAQVRHLTIEVKQLQQELFLSPEAAVRFAKTARSAHLTGALPLVS